MAKFDDLPPEILRIITQLIYLDHLPRSLFRCIDPHGLPSCYPDGRLISSTQASTQSTLHALCLTNVRLYHAARPLLWRRLQITLPYSFLLLLRSLGASRLAEAYEQLGGPEGKRGEGSALPSTSSDAEAQQKTGDATDSAELDDRMSFNSMLAAVGLARVTGGTIYSNRRLSRTSEPDFNDAMDLVWTEEPLHSGGGATSRYQVTLRQDESYASDVHRYPRVLDFSTFTTQGMRRTVAQGEEARFVTPAKLLALITSVSHGLMAFGAGPTMDSALTVEVLEALLFRDGEHVAAASLSGQSPHRTLRGVSLERSREREVRGQRRRRLESLDLCNCVSRHFEVALTRFVDKYLRKFSGRATSTVVEEGGGAEDEAETEEVVAQEEEQRGRGRSRARDGSRPVTLSRSISTSRHAPSLHPARATRFPSVERLCLHGVHFASDLISPFVLAFPRLTHLDLTGTKVDDGLLQALIANPDMELESLSLAHCPRISSECLTELLVDSSVCAGLIELSLEGSLLFPTPITFDDLKTIITMAPSMRSGSLRYLDLGGCGLTDELLRLFPRQPSLIDLGLNATPQVTLEVLSEFLINKAPNVQVLELVESCHDVRVGPLSIVRLNVALLEPCAAVPPLSISEQLIAMGFRGGEDGVQSPPRVAAPAAKTNLRVVGLGMPTLRQVGGALGSWQVILGKGRRGWLVDLSSGPDPDAVDHDLEGDEDDDGEGGSGSGIASLRADTTNALGSSSVSPFRSVRGRMANNEAEQRGRDPRRSSSSMTWEPETPPRRPSRSPSVKAPLSRRSGAGSGSTSLLRRAASSSHSRSRPQHATLSSTALTASGSSQGASHLSVSSSLAVPPATSEPEQPVERRAQVIRNLPKTHPRRLVLEQLSRANGHVNGTTGWHSRKMEVLLGLGMLGRESGSYAYAAYQA